MSEAEFEMMTPQRFFVKLRFFNEEQDRLLRYKTDLVRRQTTMILSLFAKKPVTADQIWPVPWDNNNIQKETDNMLPQGEMTRIAQRLWQKD